MNEAIKKAIEGGYDHDYQFLIDMKDNRGDTMFLLDPLFWKALGKALGWRRQFAVSSYGATEELDDEAGYSWDGVKEDDNSVAVLIPQWQHHAHQYFDLVLTGGDTEKFWLDLLNPNRE